MTRPPGQPDSRHIPAQPTVLARRHLRGYPVRNYHLKLGGRALILSGPADPDSLLGEPRTEERFDTDHYMPYWSDLWPASVGLADYLLASHLLPIGGHGLAVELGCGLGLAGIAAGMLGWRVIFTDYDADSLAYVVHNAASNGLGDFEARLLDWRRPPEDLRADLLLGADVIYEKRNHDSLLDCTGTILRDGGIAIFADPHRDGAKGFADAAGRAGLTVSVGRWSDRQPGGQEIAMNLYFVRNR